MCIAQVNILHITDKATGGVDFAEVNLVQTGEFSRNDGMAGEAHQVINRKVKLFDLLRHEGK